MNQLKKVFVKFIKTLDLGSALAVRLTKLTGKSKTPIHPKHLLTQKPWFTKYISKKDSVLDIGCGNGQNSLKAAKIAKKVIGIEISSESLAIAQKTTELKKIRNIKFEIADLEKKLKFNNQNFDKVIFLDVLEHLLNRDMVLKEIKRILKKDGLLFLGVPNSETSWKRFQRSAGINSFSDPDHKIEFSENSIKKLLKKHGFKIIDFSYGRYDIPARGITDIFGAISLSFYKSITDWRSKKVLCNPEEASGFEIVAKLS
jgi:ubiquinone/menaquinone biosynthesis C-methylase UbiE